jgi:hypothetical protein
MSDVHAQVRTIDPRLGPMSGAALEIFDRASMEAPDRRWRRLARALVVALVLGLGGSVLGCAETPECRLSSDCPAPLFCVEGLCAAECREDRDCRAGEACREGVCRMREAGRRLCATAVDCEVGETCAGGVCERVRLVRDAGAPAGDGGASPNPPVDAGAPVDAGGADAGPPGLPYGAVCARAADCASNLCLGPQGASSGRCTEACTTDADCFYPDTCLDIQGAGRFCGQAPSGRATGDPCPSGASECASGLCVDTMTGSGPICTQPCGGLPACPAGLTCQPVPDGQGGAVAVCIPGSGGGFGASCGAAADCATGLCVGVGGGGVCTALCASTPCPSGWSCTLAEDANGSPFRICAPAGAVGGQFGDACAGSSGCASGLCLFDARTSSAFCTQRCASHADCASVPGLRCVALASGAQVCGPQ